MFIVADIGGTKTRVARSFDLETIDEPLILPTEQLYEQGMMRIREAAKHLAGSQKIGGMSIGITGTISGDGKTPLTTPHLPDWRSKALGRELEVALGTTVWLANDTAQVGLGEAVFGAGKGARILVYMTVSTGVNGVRVVDRRIDPSTFGFEIGGQYLIMDGNKKTLEELVSGRAIEERYGIPPKMIEKDSPVWEELAQYLAIGVHNTILHWSPEKVVLGGSMFNEVGIPVGRVQAHVENMMTKFSSVPPIVHSSLGDLGGLWGGVARLRLLS